MFSWAKQRQLIYGTIVIISLLIVIGLPTYFLFFNRAPTCSDGKQNGDETGIDCGGSCSSIRVCQGDVLPEPILLWTRAFPVGGGSNNLVAYVQNPNVGYTAEPIPYIFAVYDSANILLGTREGLAYVPPVRTFPIFEGVFTTGDRVPAKVSFNFIEPAVWKKHNSVKSELTILEDRLRTDLQSGPRVDADIQNETIDTFRDIEVVAIIYDELGNAQASSRTKVDVLFGNERKGLVFTWPKPFDFEVSKIEIVPKLPISNLITR